jgi:arylsulfatase A-like enzyme
MSALTNQRPAATQTLASVGAPWELCLAALAFVSLTACGSDLGASAGASALPTNQSTPDGRPNVLLVIADDLGVDMVGAYGSGMDPAPTPHIDALAEEGLRFVNAWSTPLCTPTRAAILTGRYPFRTGMGCIIYPESRSLDLDETTLPELLSRRAGYRCGAFGKWHLNNLTRHAHDGSPVDPDSGGLLHPNLSGFGFYSGALYNMLCDLPYCERPYPYDYYGWGKVVNGERQWCEVYATTDTVDSALGWIQQTSEPWFCYLAFNAPHEPMQAPPARLNSSGLLPGEKPPIFGDQRPHYAAMVEAMDSELGRLLAELEPDVRRRTTVIFVGDNGTPRPVTRPEALVPRAKTTLYQPGIHVPLVVSGAGVSARGVHEALVDTTDLFATIVELAGLDPAHVLPDDTRLDGVSFFPRLVDQRQAGSRDFAFSEIFYPMGIPPTPDAPDAGGSIAAAWSGSSLAFRAVALRDPRYKLIRTLRESPFIAGVYPASEQLFDLCVDPYEAQDLLAQGALTDPQRAAHSALRRELDRLLESDG